MPKGSYSGKQRKLAAVAPPRDKITAADLKKLRSKKKEEEKMKTLTQRQQDALARHKKKGTHTRKHMEEMKKLMLKGKTFTEAHNITMKKVGK